MNDHIRLITEIFGYSLFAFLVFIILEPFFFSFLIKYKLGKKLRTECFFGEKAIEFFHLHKHKEGTPTMAGILIWGSVLITIFFSRFLAYAGLVDHSLLSRKEVYLPLFTLIIMGLLGAVDDLFNIFNIGKSKGIKLKPKLFLLILFGTIGAFWFHFKLEYDTIHIPFLGNFFINGWYFPLFILVIVGTANAVNFTDGLDGLAGGLLIIAFACFGAIAYFKTNFILATFCTVICAALFAFLWFNISKAKFFMGDTGSLALGATLAVIAMMIDSLIVLPIIGGIFVAEALSVIIQIASKKFRNGKKVFLVAPIHHHFEKLGWGEPKVVMRFWIIGGMLGIMGLIIELIGI